MYGYHHNARIDVARLCMLSDIRFLYICLWPSSLLHIIEHYRTESISLQTLRYVYIRVCFGGIVIFTHVLMWILMGASCSVSAGICGCLVVV